MNNNQKEFWVKDEEENKKIGHNNVICFRDELCFYQAYIKWDGCIDLTRYYNQPFTSNNDLCDYDNIRICDLDEFINMLIELKEKAKEQFGEDWPNL
jgi:hypothetical protein